MDRVEALAWAYLVGVVAGGAVVAGWAAWQSRRLRAAWAELRGALRQALDAVRQELR